MAADAAGSVCRFAALPVAVRLTDVTVVAVRGTVSCAWSCRRAEPASTAPRLHEDVPSALPQPKLKSGVPAPAGDVRSWILASGTLPPVAQADTAQCVCCPRSPLCCKGTIPTHNLTCAVPAAARTPLPAAAPAAPSDLAMAAVKTMACPRALPAVALAAVALLADVGVAVAGAGVVAVGVGVGVGVGVAAVGVGVGVGVGVAAVGVGVGVAAVGVGVGVGVVAVGVGVAVVCVGEGVGVAVFLAVGLGDAATAWRGSHDSRLPAAVPAAAAAPAVAATMLPATTVTRTLPAATVTTVRRPRAKRI
jgi:hypothetical protein